MQLFYFLPLFDHFEILKQAASNYNYDIGLVFRRFTDTGFNSRFKVCSWIEDLPSIYTEGGYKKIYLATNGSLPVSEQDWDFPDREQQNLIIIEGGRIKANELEQSFLRVFSKKTNCKPLYQGIRRLIKNRTEQGLYAKDAYYKNLYYSEASAKYKMMSSFGGTEYTKEGS